MADRELDDVREELGALQAAFAAEREKSSALEDKVRTTQAALASRLDDANTSKNVVDRPIVVTPARRIEKFRGQSLKPGDATMSGWLMPEDCWQPHSSCRRQVRLPYLLIILVVGHARKFSGTGSKHPAAQKQYLKCF